MNRKLGIVGAAGIVAGLMLASAPAQAQSSAPSPAARTHVAAYVPPPIAWGPCSSSTLQQFGAQCGMLTVPLDYAHPAGTKIQLAVSRVTHTTPSSQYQGVVLVNPGGPGGSGLVYSIFQSFIPNDGGMSYDWIGFDPRGVGSSVPSLTCDGNYFGFNRPSFVPVNERVEHAWLVKTRNYTRACKAAGGALLEHLKTTDSVADMESIRIALGQSKINYYGFSYGTYLGQVYATLHPNRVRRFILDSNVDPRRVWYQANLDQDYAFDKNLGIYLNWVAAHDSSYHLGTSGAALLRTYYRVLNRLRTHPQAGGLVGPDEWTDAIVPAAYYVYGWDTTAQAIAAAVNGGDFTAIRDLYVSSTGGQGPGADNGYAVYLAVQCSDVRWPQAWSTWERDNNRVYSRAPFLTWDNAWYNAPCRGWGAKPGTPVTVNGQRSPAMLLVDETNDAATPYAGSLYVRSIFPKSVLIEGVGGTTHAGSLSGVACTDDKIAAYLATGALPKRVSGNRSDVQCAPVPPPTPTVAAATASRKATTKPARVGTLRQVLGPIGRDR
ncbi:pimeloyl-ACP methyl ester carboxylesterase [Phycicoccus badiiscoriae]|uniref:Pimeloyl-ACP methyl ester carboxylesterase n=1 Tax=Pedococcus badiiscoriae TaxID=642776 RepID=A0A852WF49_9MICO|nr:alpha/beta fold hydrolase [Pedococcus badiiscoriae]NYG07628.1 pimeloyl-ACP methyl ester carboxylesterase [Pedococcus badiiscoriae]